MDIQKPVPASNAKLIKVEQGLAHYRCLTDRFHVFQQSIPNPFRFTNPPPTLVPCIYSHSEVLT